MVADLERLDFRCFLWPSESNPMLLKTAVGPDLHRRHCGGQVSHAHQVVGGAGHGKNPIHSTDAAMPHLPHQRNRLQPAEALLDSLSLFLAEGVTCVPRGAAINRASAAPRRPPPSRWPGTLPRPRSDHCDSPPTDSPCNSTSTPCLRLCAPATPRDRSSIRAFHSTAARRESSPWDCPDRHPTERTYLPWAENSSLLPRLPAACRPP